MSQKQCPHCNVIMELHEHTCWNCGEPTSEKKAPPLRVVKGSGDTKRGSSSRSTATQKTIRNKAKFAIYLNIGVMLTLAIAAYIFIRRSQNKSTPEDKEVVEDKYHTPEEDKNRAGNHQKNSAATTSKNVYKPVKRQTPVAKTNKTRLTKQEIQLAVNPVRKEILGCFRRFRLHGLVYVHMKIAGNGKPVKVFTSGRFAGTGLARCIMHEMRKTVYPPVDLKLLEFMVPFSW